jgi:hypothetical protein
MPILQESEGATLNGGNYIDVNGSCNVINIGSDTSKHPPPHRAFPTLTKVHESKGKGEGINLLLNSYVQREAIHDSNSRGDLGCHRGTREGYVLDITRWGRREWMYEKRACLMTGPAGAGKSAIARTCARKFKAAGNFGASFFFYRPSRWNDPRKFIPTIAYQLATQYPVYHDCIDAVIRSDPLVLEKEMDIQFLELLVKPLLEQSLDGRNVKSDLVIVVDGLDECATVDAQLQIIDLVTTSIHEQTTPFSWAFFSRPEPPITSAFSSKIATNVSWMLPLTLSGNADSDIEAYLRGSFEVIRVKHSIPASVDWPEEEDIYRLVSQSAGLFVYPVIVIRYIDGLDKGTSRLEERLREVLQLDVGSKEHPFLALDLLYKLLMMQIPEGVLSDTMSLLHLDQSAAAKICDEIWLRYYSTGRPGVLSYCFVLDVSPAAFHVAIGNLHSALEVTTSESGRLKDLRFYHRSFIDFLLDPRRSERYCIRSRAICQHCREMTMRAMLAVVDAEAGEYANCLIRWKRIDLV